jgi:hypothetical protein
MITRLIGLSVGTEFGTSGLFFTSAIKVTEGDKGVSGLSQI